jgi:hypothetical protein
MISKILFQTKQNVLGVDNDVGVDIDMDIEICSNLYRDIALEPLKKVREKNLCPCCKVPEYFLCDTKKILPTIKRFKIQNEIMFKF